MAHDANQPFNVLFLCTGNSARSIIAEALLNRRPGRGIHSVSAGSTPKGEVHPFTLDLLRRMIRVCDDRRNTAHFHRDQIVVIDRHSDNML